MLELSSGTESTQMKFLSPSNNNKVNRLCFLFISAWLLLNLALAICVFYEILFPALILAIVSIFFLVFGTRALSRYAVRLLKSQTEEETWSN